MSDLTPRHYRAPGWFTRRVFNPIVRGATRLGIGMWGARELRVRGRSTGAVRTTVVNVLTHDGNTYLVAPRGETDWVRNLRAAGSGELRAGRRVESFTATEVADGEKVAILRTYLRRWKWEVGQFFDGVGPDSSDGEIAAIAPRHPVFAVR